MIRTINAIDIHIGNDMLIVAEMANDEGLMQPAYAEIKSIAATNILSAIPIDFIILVPFAIRIFWFYLMRRLTSKSRFFSSAVSEV